MQVDQSESREAEGRKAPLRFWNARWAPQKLFLAARRDLSAAPASQVKKIDLVDLSVFTAALTVVKA